MEKPSTSTHLGISANIGFNYNYKDCMVVHPSDMHFIWAQGRTVVIKSVEKDQNTYLKGHEGRINTIACSKSGNLFASGDLVGAGFQAAVIVWDFNQLDMLFRVRYHKESIQALSFSCDDTYLCSLGGLQDTNQVVCWDMAEGRSECVAPATDQNDQECLDLKFFNKDSTRFVTGHNNAVKFWQIDPYGHKFHVFDCQLGLNKRFVNCLEIDQNDAFLYCGTRMGDILEIFLDTARYRRTGPLKRIFKGGINQINSYFGKHLIVACADGNLAKIDKKSMQFEEEVQLHGGPVVSLANSQEKIYALTANGKLHSAEGEAPLGLASVFMTSMANRVGEIVFPAGFSEVFAVRSFDEITIWNVQDQKELLTIKLQEFEGQAPHCNCLEFMPDGRSIVTGWTDGRVRSFTPQSGKLLYLIRDAHRPGLPVKSFAKGVRHGLTPGGVNCLATSLNCEHVLTGGADSEIKLWQIGKQTQKLVISQRMHVGEITSVKYIQNDTFAASASIDGTIIIWDLRQTGVNKELHKHVVLKAPIAKGLDDQDITGITALEYNPNLNELLALGLDLKVTYWNLDDSKMLKQLQAAYQGEVKALALSMDGELVVVGDDTGEVKVFTYADCRLVHIENVHSAPISSIAVSPDNSLIVTADELGQMFFWRI